MAVAPCGLWLLQEYVWGKDSVWTEMVRGKDIQIEHVTAPIFGKVTWNEINYPSGNDKHQAVFPPKATVLSLGHAGQLETTAIPLQYFKYRTGDVVGESEPLVFVCVLCSYVPNTYCFVKPEL